MQQALERRSGRDRRQHEMAYPQEKERRRRIEQRKLEFEEVTMDESDWQQFFQATRQASTPPHDDPAAHIFERASFNRASF